MNYTVSAKSNIGPVGYGITVEIVEKDVPTFLVKGVLYEAQRMAASKAVKALGGGKRDSIVYNEATCDIVEQALRDVFGVNAEIACNEHVKGLKAEIKFAQARKILANNRDREQKVADRVGYDGDLFDEHDGGPTYEFLTAIHEWINNPFADDEENA